jgi:hypothetical protein
MTTCVCVTGTKRVSHPPKTAGKETCDNTYLHMSLGCAQCLRFVKKAHPLPWHHSYKRLLRKKKKRSEDILTEVDMTVLNCFLLVFNVEMHSVFAMSSKAAFSSRHKVREIHRTQHPRQSCHMNMYNSVPLIKLTVFCNHHSYLFPKMLPSLQTETLYPPSTNSSLLTWSVLHHVPT